MVKKECAEFMRKVETLLKKRYSKQMRTSLYFSNPFQLLVATILSAQAQDASVNRATPKLFIKFNSIEKFASAKPSDLYRYVRSIGLYKTKAKHIVEAARAIRARFGGKVPDTMEGLTSLPGVGRKTANVVLSNAFGKNLGIAIDTHCITVANRLGLVKTKDPHKIELRLMDLLPEKEWGNISNLFIALGRDVCTSRKKLCNKCILKDVCPSSTTVR
ncbi:MAG: endonuclease III [Candidatus Micrarchaeaceae archaeon]